MQKRYDLINYLIEKYKYTSYLEIGVEKGSTIEKISLEDKIGVDPEPQSKYVTHPVTSDDFFKTNKKWFDIIFIDGNHLEEQVDRDIKHSLIWLKTNGTIVLHDCNPPTEEHGLERRVFLAWNGTVWRSITKQRCLNKEVSIHVVDIDWGCGILKRGEQEVYSKAPLATCLQWPYFDINRKEILNLVSSDEFQKIY